jgi:hypothetical protein
MTANTLFSVIKSFLKVVVAAKLGARERGRIAEDVSMLHSKRLTMLLES